MDDLLAMLSEVARILLPIVGVTVLVFLAIFIYNLIKVIKVIPKTVESVNDLIVNATEKVDQLQGPLDTIKSVSSTVEKVNTSAVGIVGSAVQFGSKNSEAIMSWGKEFFDKKKNKDLSKERKHKEKEEEDFGIYE